MNKELSLTLANAAELTPDPDGWCLIAPYGEHPKQREVLDDDGETEIENYIQVMDRDAADAMISNANTFFRRIKRAFIKPDIFKEHPDGADNEERVVIQGNRSKESQGLINAIRKTDRGLEAQLNLNNSGGQAVAQGYKYPSVSWDVHTIGNGRMPNGESAVRVRPFRVVSIGLVKRPNIKTVESLANSARDSDQPTTTTENTMLKQTLIGWLSGRGVKIAADAGDQAVLDSITGYAGDQATAAITLGNAKTENESKITTLTNQVTEVTKQRDDAKTALTTAQTNLTNAETRFTAERKARAGDIVDLAIHKGQIAVAEREAQITTLTNSAAFDAAVEAVSKLPAKHKVAQRVNLSNAAASANDSTTDSRTAGVQLVNAAQELQSVNPKLTWDQAWSGALAKMPSLAAILTGRNN